MQRESVSVWRWFLLLLISCTCAEAQVRYIAPAPSSRVEDEHEFFRGEEELRDEISERLKRIYEERDFEVYLVLRSGLIGESSSELADKYHDKWLGPKSDGIVLLLDTEFGTGGAMAYSRKLYGGEYSEEGLAPQMEHYKLEGLLKEAQESTLEGEEDRVRVHHFLTLVSDHIETFFIEEEAEGASAYGWKTFLGWFALVAAAAALLVGLLWAVFLRKEGNAHEGECYFPDVLVGERLGAPNGGGKVSVQYFAPPSSER